MNQAFLLLADDAVKVSGMELIDLPDSLELICRFTLNFTVILILVRWLYYSVAKRKDYLFTYILISCIVFFLCYLLENVKLQIGFALGLFAIFGIIRYRTDSMPIKEMTYLFLVIGISVINALANKKTSIVEVLFTNAAIIAITYALEKVWLLKHESSKIITYEKINLILPEKRQEMIEDLESRTGIKNIKRVEIGKINFLKDTCRVTIFFDEYSSGVNYEESGRSINNDGDED
ncbi:MAG TPA: DUF4956 domain-containing protein [Bacteroidales bacterium]|nr:DUF4956 domain-containing protein [Bacteroidales bacterium]HPT22075.1 DUF4956 domain-containing protein [Bacteroidales bacterium]